MLDVENSFSDAENDHDCICHGADKVEYRLMRGSSVEGLSIREVAFDNADEIIAWDAYPATIPAGSVNELKMDLDAAISDLMKMREAFNKPLLDETEIEHRLTK